MRRDRWEQWSPDRKPCRWPDGPRYQATLIVLLVSCWVMALVAIGR